MHSPLAVGDTEVYTLWWISAGVIFVVCIVAAGLLQNILVVVRNIDKNVAEIWSVGKRIANCTVELWMLGRVNSVVGEIRNSAYRINDVATTIASHAEQCRHCPACARPYVGAGMRSSAAPAAGAQPQQERPPWARPLPSDD
jgi:type IV secretory pathway TrbL component